MRRSVILYINGNRHEISGAQAFAPLTDYLRYAQRLTGTKVVCAEGDCGACTVLCSSRPGEKLKSLNSCITIPALLDGSHLITVEGLEDAADLHPVQKAMVNCHGAQCGFCTPGIVCSLAGLFEEHNEVTEKRARNALTGNLCRCTGYEPILKSAAAVAEDLTGRLKSRYLNDAKITQELRQISNQDLFLECAAQSYFAPTSLQSLLEYKQSQPKARLIASATDMGVMANKGKLQYQALCSLNRVPGNEKIREDADHLVVGAGATLTDLQNAAKNLYPEFYELLKIFASPQIKNVATLVGNVANASPIADTLPFLFVMKALVEIQSTAGQRVVNINDFYRGYKVLDLKPDEIITAIRIPKLRGDEVLKLYKVSRRKDLDISCVTAGFLFKMRDETIAEARVAYGGVGPTVLRLTQTEDFLRGKTLDLNDLAQASETALAEVAPISDVRGSKDYRLLLVKNLFLKMHYDQVRGTKHCA